jgi:hypothetical protein
MASIAQEPVAHEPAPRIRLTPLALRLGLALVAPVLLALLADWLLGWLPWLTLAAMLVCVPLATVLVSKAALRDLDRVFAQVAPPDEETPPARPELDAGVPPADL